jgi:hypothetical protein
MSVLSPGPLSTQPLFLQGLLSRRAGQGALHTPGARDPAVHQELLLNWLGAHMCPEIGTAEHPLDCSVHQDSSFNEDVSETLLAVQTAMACKLQILPYAKPMYNTGVTKALQMVHVAPLTTRQLH